MIKGTKRVLALALAFALMFAVTLPLAAFAAEDIGLAQQEAAATVDVRPVGGDWTTVWASSAGVQSPITITMNNADSWENNIRIRHFSMGWYWEEFCAIGINGTRTFWFGPDVVEIQLQAVGAPPTAQSLTTATLQY